MKRAAAALLLLALAAGNAAGGDPPAAPFEPRVPGVGPVPAPIRETLGLSPFYEQHVDAGGFPILASRKVDGRAMLEAKHVVEAMLLHRPGRLEALARRKVRLVVMATTEFTTDVPEHADLAPASYWDRRARGLGASEARTVVSCAEENLLGIRGDPYDGESILIHEFGHTLHHHVLSRSGPMSIPGFDGRLKAAYEAAMAARLWSRTYAATNTLEYWAEGVQAWFDSNVEADDLHNGINTREELKAYDPGLAALCAETFGDLPWRYRRPRDRSPPSPHLLGFDRARAPRFTWDAWRKDPVPGMATVPRVALPAMPESARPRWASPSSYAPSTVLFHNRSGEVAHVDWIDFQGNPVSYFRLDSGEEVVQPTFEGHVFRFGVVRKGAPPSYFVATKGDGTAVLEPAPR